MTISPRTPTRRSELASSSLNDPSSSSQDSPQMVSFETLQRSGSHKPSSSSSRRGPVPHKDNNSTPIGENELSALSLNKLRESVYKSGFLDGLYSDFEVECFGNTYRLHRLILNRCSYFSSMFSGRWKDASHNKVTLNFDDKYITQRAFETAIGILYGAPDAVGFDDPDHVISVLAVSCFLNLQELSQRCINYLLSNMSRTAVVKVLLFSVSGNYGTVSSILEERAKCFLCAEGWEMGYRSWLHIPGFLAAEVLRADAFFTPSEFDRVLFISQVYNLKQAYYIKRGLWPGNVDAPDELKWIKDTLIHGVYYMHMTFEELQIVKKLKDFEGHSLIPDYVFQDALWKQMQLRQVITNASPDQLPLGLLTDEDSDESENRTKEARKGFFIPVTDETTSGRYSRSLTPLSCGDNDKPNLGEIQDCLDQRHRHGDSPKSNPHGQKLAIFPPYRFCVEFRNVDLLGEDKRIYSRTVWYAGSYWNVYALKSEHKKRPDHLQLGVYLHRGSEPLDLKISSPKCLDFGALPESRSGSQAQSRTSSYGGDNSAFYYLSGQPSHRRNNSSHNSLFSYMALGAMGGVRSDSVSELENDITMLSMDSSRANIRLTEHEEEEANAHAFRASRGGGLDYNAAPPQGETQKLKNKHDSFQFLSTASRAYVVDILNEHNNDDVGDDDNAKDLRYLGVAADDDNLFDLPRTPSNLSAEDEESMDEVDYEDNDDDDCSTLQGEDEFAQHKTEVNVKEGDENDSEESNGESGANEGTKVQAERQKRYLELKKQHRVRQRELERVITFSRKMKPAVDQFKDPRKVVYTYFEIYTPKRQCRSGLTCYSSGPDKFTHNQSWGWKSSSLYNATCSLNNVKTSKTQTSCSLSSSSSSSSSPGSLKFMICLGHI